MRCPSCDAEDVQARPTRKPQPHRCRVCRRDLGKDAWHLSHRIREACRTDPVLCRGPAAVDETYVGGRETHQHADRKLRAGRGTVGKTLWVGLKNRPGTAPTIAMPASITGAPTTDEPQAPAPLCPGV